MSKEPKVELPEDIKKILEENEALKKEKEAREVEEKKVKDPMSGPGHMCEAFKITMGEAWQLRTVISQDGREMELEQCPEGYQAREGAGAYYIVGLEDKDPKKCAFLPNCRSKYTSEYKYRMKKPVHFQFEQESPEGDIHLCEHHAKVLLGK